MSVAGHPIVTRTAIFAPMPASEADVVVALLERAAPLVPGRAHLIVTPNMNHLAALQTSAVLGQAYTSSSMVLADGWPVVRLARALGVRVCRRTTGSGVVSRLAQTPGERRRLFVIGGTTPASTSAAAVAFAEAGWIVGSETAPAALLSGAEGMATLSRTLQDFDPDVVLVGLGSPKQELVAMNLIASTTTTAVFLCVGSAIDFLAGHKRRAPLWMRRSGIEWLHRMCTEPGRLGARYSADLLPFALVVLQSLRAARERASERTGVKG